MSYIRSILEEIGTVLERQEEGGMERIVAALQNKRIFVIGEGRSGLMGKSFAMRLMHLGATCMLSGRPSRLPSAERMCWLRFPAPVRPKAWFGQRGKPRNWVVR